MSSVTETMLARACRVLHRDAGEALHYQRGDSACDVHAIPAKANLGVLDEASGAPIEWEGLDWLIQPGELVLEGTLATPQKGDKIVRGGEVYDVLPPPGGKCWEWVGPYQLEYRVHTKVSEWPI